MIVMGVAGWSGSGKTTLLRRLIPALVSRGVTVSTVKHAHHDFDIDQPGKDSFEHRRAGATEVMVASGRRWALMHELRDAEEPPLDQLIARMSPVDVLLVEGYRRGTHPKIEVYRPSVGKPLLQPDDPNVIAVVSDSVVPGLPVPLYDLDDAEAIATFILAQGGHAARGRDDLRRAAGDGSTWRN